MLTRYRTDFVHVCGCIWDSEDVATQLKSCAVCAELRRVLCGPRRHTHEVGANGCVHRGACVWLQARKYGAVLFVPSMLFVVRLLVECAKCR